MKIEVNAESPYSATVRGAQLKVTLDGMSQAGLDKVFAYGMQRILNDAGAGAMLWLDKKGNPCASAADAAKDEKGKPLARPKKDVQTEALALAEKRWAALKAGEVVSRGPTADPRLASARVILVKSLVKRGVARKAIPKLPDLDTIYALAKEAGIDRAAFDKVVTAHMKASALSV